VQAPVHVYIVYAHPARASFSRDVLAAFSRGLHDAGHTYEVGDLYEMGFEPEMDEAQYCREVGLDPDAPVPDDVRREQEKIGRAGALAFIFPLWWSDVPAKLKGWFDRVLTYGYAYFYNEAEERFTKISIAKALVICPAGHTAEHLEETGVAEAMRRIMLNDRLLGVGVREARLEILGGMMPKDDTYRQANLAKAYALGRYL
jgi:NAD(P)H dehydrogenase (quinone)